MRDWVHGVGHSPVCQILLQIVSRALIMASPPACTSSAGTLSAPAEFPFSFYIMFSVRVLGLWLGLWLWLWLGLWLGLGLRLRSYCRPSPIG